jgi:DNA adenine methylase
MKHKQLPGRAEAAAPPLKWAGGKRWLAPYLKTVWKRHPESKLVEPLCGGMAVSLALLPGKALLNDINCHLLNFYQWLKKGLTIDLPMENDRQLYYLYREQFNRLIAEGGEGSKEAAELFYYLNRTCYNGLCRFNKKGFFNVPFGRYARINYRRDFSAYQSIFEKWDFSCLDFEDLTLGREDFVYADPPYDVQFTHYHAHGFSWEDQVRFAHWLSRHPGPVVLSNQATKRIVELYLDLGFRLEYLEGPRRISCKSERPPAGEVLATKGIRMPIMEAAKG